MRINDSSLPQHSIILNYINKPDYLDCFEGILNGEGSHAIRTKDAGIALFASAPKWVEKLMVFRNKIVSVVGLKQAMT